MANRHLARSVVLQTLFEWDFTNRSAKDISEILYRDIIEFAPGMGDPLFAEKLLELFISKRDDIDNIITKAAPEWPIEKISIVDRNVLRIGLAELLFADRVEVPAKVAINEAIELAKTFGGEGSGRFVNGVLGTVYKELGEPGKDEISKKKTAPVTLKKLGGGFVYAKHLGQVYVALVHDIFGHWTLSKGGIEVGKDEAKATLNEISKELGLRHLKAIEKIGENEYLASHPEEGKIKKHVFYYLIESKFDDIKLEQKGGLDDAKWFKLKDILDLNFYDDILPIVTKGVQLLANLK